jgi:hypothetical protein
MGLWTQLSPATSPSGRTGFGFAYDKLRNYAILFGGYSPATGATSNQETWKWDGTTWTQLFPSTIPTSASVGGEGTQSLPLLVWDAANQKIMLCYFTNSSPHTFKTYLWDGSDWQLQSPANSPASDFGLPDSLFAGIAEAPGIGNVIMFGGTANDGNGSSATWLWDGTTWTQVTPATTPPKRFHPFMTYDSIRGEVVMYGGTYSGTGERFDTYTWDGSDWTLETTTIGSGESGNGLSFAFSPPCGYAVRFGGIISNNDTFTWQWDGTDWAGALASPTPQENITPYAQLLIHDEARQQVVLFGGVAATGGPPLPTLDETWVWECAATPAIASIHHTFGLGR